MDIDDECDARLVLGLGFSSSTVKTHKKSLHQQEELLVGGGDSYRQASPHGAAASFSSGGIKRVSIEDNEDDLTARKKLMFTKQQSDLLEETFKKHSYPSPEKKQDLAKQLNLCPRQVEMWFQNRRRKKKFKQTEMDCELLKKSCEKLREENRRLQKEVQELKALNLAKPFYTYMPAPTLTLFPSCESIGDGTSKNPFSID